METQLHSSMLLTAEKRICLAMQTRFSMIEFAVKEHFGRSASSEKKTAENAVYRSVES